MKRLSSIITSKLFFVAAGLSAGFAGNSFADTVSAYRQSSGTKTNTGVTTYVGNTVWGADSQSFGSKFYSEWAQENGVSLRWDANKKAFVIWEDYEVSSIPDENGLTTLYTTESLSFDTVFALSGSAVFKNEGTANLQYHGEKTMEDWTGKIDGSVGRQEYLFHELLVAFSDNSKMMNAGTLTFSSTTTSSWETTTDPDGTMHQHSGQPPQFEVYFRDNAQLLNSGTISAKTQTSGWYDTTVNFYFYENAKFTNEEGGEVRDIYLSLYDNSSLENSGSIGEGSSYGWTAISLSENGVVVNTSSGKISAGEICFEKGYGNDRMKVENHGEISVGSIDYDFLYLNGNSMEAIFENHGTLEFNNMGVSLETYQQQPFSRFENLNKNLQIKNYGLMRSRSGNEIQVCSYVDVTLAEGSRVEGKLSLGNSFEYDEYVGVWDDGYWDETLVRKTAQKEKSVLNILVTGKDGNTALVSNGIELNNAVVLKFEFDEGFSPKKYTLNLWDGALSGNGYFDTSYRYGNYEAFLSQSDGTITIKDTSVGEEYLIAFGDGNGSYQLGQKDLAEFGEDLAEFSGSISGTGQVDAMHDVTFSGDARSHVGKTVVGGTFTVTKDAYLSQGVYEVGGTMEILGGEKTFGGAVSGAGSINVQAGTVEFKNTVGVDELNISKTATLVGKVNVTSSESKVSLEGTLSVNADKQEKVSLAPGAVLFLGADSKLVIRGDKSSSYARVAGVASSRLENGERVVIIEGGKIEGKDLKSLLEEDASVKALARQYAVIMNTDNGLSVQVIKNASALSSSVAIPDDLREAAEIVLGEVQLDLTPGLKTMDEISGMGGDDPLANAILTDPEKAGEMVMNILPIHYAAMVAMTTESFHSDVRSIASRLEQRRYDGYAPTKKHEFFFQLQGTSVDNDDGLDAPTFDYDTVGFLVGADYKLDPRTVVGLSVGADFGDAKIRNGGGELEMSDMRFTGFIGKTIEERFYVNAGAQVGSGAFDIKRKTVWGNPKGDATVWNFGGFFESGMLMTLANSVFAMPYVGFDYMHSHAESFDERGMGAIWRMDTLTGDSLRARVGCGFSWNFAVSERKCRLGLDVAYAHDFLGEEVDVEVKGDFPKMTVKAMPEDVFSVSPSLNVNLSELVSVYANYTFEAGTDSMTQHNANIGVRMHF